MTAIVSRKRERKEVRQRPENVREKGGKVSIW
jgi:hypothetical protein